MNVNKSCSSKRSQECMKRNKKKAAIRCFLFIEDTATAAANNLKIADRIAPAFGCPQLQAYTIRSCTLDCKALFGSFVFR